jgi:hypothetical protein
MTGVIIYVQLAAWLGYYRKLACRYIWLHEWVDLYLAGCFMNIPDWSGWLPQHYHTSDNYKEAYGMNTNAENTTRRLTDSQ